MQNHSMTPKTCFTLGLECLCHIYSHQDSFESSPRGQNPWKKKANIKEHYFELEPSVKLVSHMSGLISESKNEGNICFPGKKTIRGRRVTLSLGIKEKGVLIINSHLNSQWPILCSPDVIEVISRDFSRSLPISFDLDKKILQIYKIAFFGLLRYFPGLFACCFLSLSVVQQSITLISPQMIFSLSVFLPIFFCLLFVLFGEGSFLWSQQVADEREGEIWTTLFSSKFIEIGRYYSFGNLFPIRTCEGLSMLGHVKLESPVKLMRNSETRNSETL